MYELRNVMDRRIVKLPQYFVRQIFVAGRTVMQLFLTFVVLAFSVALILYATQIILYVVPTILIGLVISFVIDCVRHHSKISKHRNANHSA